MIRLAAARVLEVPAAAHQPGRRSNTCADCCRPCLVGTVRCRDCIAVLRGVYSAVIRL
ncbi:hypothetical protein [Streptomonospora sp. PA3]|uniref:hypothetical protein n=1 Tax=Streptomonospora sp. PA3 TaxID=2607326 RepID=UPI0012DE648E|nr:hypothetical protein [Streptomonospora sp. PA3]